MSKDQPAAPEYSLEQLRAMTRAAFLPAHATDYYSAVKQLFAALTERDAVRATTPTTDDEQRAREIVEKFYRTVRPSESLAQSTTARLVKTVAAALTRSRSDIIEKIEAKRDEWRKSANKADVRGRYSKTHEIRVAAANELIALLREGK